VSALDEAIGGGHRRNDALRRTGGNGGRGTDGAGVNPEVGAGDGRGHHDLWKGERMSGAAATGERKDNEECHCKGREHRKCCVGSGTTKDRI
jgi:hypothetical protein